MYISGRGLTFDDVLLVPGYNGIKSRQDVTTAVSIVGRSFGIPLISSNMDTITGVAMAQLMQDSCGLCLLHRFMSIEENVEAFKQVRDPKKVGFSIGVGQTGLQRAEALIGAGGEIVCVDVAHGHSKEVNRTIRGLREKYKENI